MTKPTFELFLKNPDTIGVVVKSGRLWRKLQDAYNTFPEDAKFTQGEEVLVKVPLSDQRRLKAILRLPVGPTFDLRQVLS